MTNKKPDPLKEYKLFGIGIIPTMAIIMVLTLALIGLYEYGIF